MDWRYETGFADSSKLLNLCTLKTYLCIVNTILGRRGSMNHNRVNWEDKSPMCYSHWNRGEPSGDGFAVEMTKWGGWNDLWTEHKRTFICQATG